jgi:hypothetical protein
VPNAGYLFPVQALSKMFRGKFCAGLKRLRSQLAFYGALAGQQEPGRFAQLLSQATEKDWNVYSKRPFAGPETVLKYLSNYTHRIAISPRRFLNLDLSQHQVTFGWRDYADGSKSKRMTLDTGEFARRFCLHILPRGFTKVRHFGLLANRGRNQRLAQARVALAKAPRKYRRSRQKSPVPEHARGPRCPFCGSERLRVIQVIRPERGRQPGGDSS